MQEKTYQWCKIATHPDELIFQDNNIAVVEVNGRTICVGKYKDGLFAFAYKCPHAGGILAHGWIDALGNVVCPLHRYKYSMANGRNVTGEGYQLKHWQVQQRAEGVFIQLDTPGILG